jgi:hypothetical protein
MGENLFGFAKRTRADEVEGVVSKEGEETLPIPGIGCACVCNEYVLGCFPRFWAEGERSRGNIMILRSG